MAMPQYELVFVVRPELEEEPLAALVNKVSQTISDLQGQVQQIEPWGKRRLAYPIKRYREGFYYLMLVELPASAVRSLDRTLRFTEDVIRHLIVRKDEESG